MGDDPHAITSIAQLHKIGGSAGPRASVKDTDHIDDICARFIAASPFALLATRGADGRLDLSPRGDPVGFVAVLDETTLAIPDRPGNRRFDSFENLMRHPELALIFMVPGHGDTLRVAGKGRLTRDPDLCAKLAISGRPAQFVLLVDVEEAYFHCAKAMIRSRIWQPEHWPDTSDVPSMAEAMVAHGKLIENKIVENVAEMQNVIDDDAANNLY